MSRFLSNDFINKDPRAKLTVAKMANIGDLVTPSAEYLTAPGYVTYGNGWVRGYGRKYRSIQTDATVLSTGNLDAGSAFVVEKITMFIFATLVAKTWTKYTKSAIIAHYPDGYNAETSRKIGGFHMEG